jgi:hypothetical protein
MSNQYELPITGGETTGFERVRVDVAHTSFFEGREFRTFKELNVASGSVYVIKAVVPVNTNLLQLELSLDSGFARIGTYVGGVEGGTFSESLPVIPTNNMTPGVNRRRTIVNGVYVNQNILTAGGTHTGGTEIDVIRTRVASGATSRSSSVEGIAGERGIAPSTFYFRISTVSGTDPITGVLRARWEERPDSF